MYLKLSKSPKNLKDNPLIYSLNLRDNENIMDIQTINKYRFLVLIKSSDTIRGGIYDIRSDQFIAFIER